MSRLQAAGIHCFLFATLITAATVHAADVERGKQIYANRCAFCHGVTGKGDGPAGTALKPAPTNFTVGDYWKAAKPDAMRAAIENGKPATAMMGFKSVLGPDEIDDVVAYLKTLAPAP